MGDSSLRHIDGFVKSIVDNGGRTSPVSLFQFMHLR